MFSVKYAKWFALERGEMEALEDKLTWMMSGVGGSLMLQLVRRDLEHCQVRFRLKKKNCKYWHRIAKLRIVLRFGLLQGQYA